MTEIRKTIEEIFIPMMMKNQTVYLAVYKFNKNYTEIEYLLKLKKKKLLKLSNFVVWIWVSSVR